MIITPWPPIFRGATAGTAGRPGIVPRPAVGEHTYVLHGDGTWKAVSGAGLGDMSGPASATDNAIARFDGAGGKNVQNSGVTIDDSNNIAGIATLTTSGAVFVGSGSTPRSSDPGVSIFRTLSGAGNSHGFSEQSEFSKNAGAAHAAFDSRFLVSGAANYDHFVSLQAAPTLSTSGTTTNLYGVYSLAGITAGAVTNSYGIYIANPAISGSGAITNSWGLYVAAHSGATNNYAAAFMGKVGIGTATPAFALDLAGSNQRLNIADSGTGYSLVKLSNSGGAVYLAKETSAGGAIVTGSAAYSVVLGGDGNVPLHLATNGVIRLTISGSGVFKLVGLPTSASGLSTGELYNDSGTLKVAA